MAISLRTIYYETKERYKLNLIAGEEGLDNVVGWVHFMEDITTMDFIKGSDLIITTGMGNNSEEWLYDLIKGLAEREESGLIINTGMYIKNVPEEIIKYCNKIGFPLFIMPWEIHLVDIMQDYCNRIFIAKQNELSENAAFFNAIFSQEDIESYEPYLIQNKYDPKESYCILTIGFIKDISESEEQDFKKKLKILIMNLSNRLFIKCSLVENDDELIIVIHNVNKKVIINYAEKLYSKCKITFDKYDISIGVGSRISGIRNISKSYRHASIAKKMIVSSEKRLFFYDELGINKLIFDVCDKDTLTDFFEEQLGELYKYDEQHNTNYMETLRLYIENNCSIQAVAEQTFSHRNTINYRIKKIKQILRNDMDSMKDKVNYQMGFYIRDVIDKLE